MHWWFHARVPVPSGMFCCGRLKGEEDPQSLKDLPTVSSEKYHAQETGDGITSSTKLLGNSEQVPTNTSVQESEPFERSNRDALNRNQPHNHSHHQPSSTEDFQTQRHQAVATESTSQPEVPSEERRADATSHAACRQTEAVPNENEQHQKQSTQTTPQRKRPRSRPLSDPAPGRHVHSSPRHHGADVPSDTADRRNVTDVDAPVESVEISGSNRFKPSKSAYDTRNASLSTRSNSQDEERRASKKAPESDQRISAHDALLKELSAHPRLQASAPWQQTGSAEGDATFERSQRNEDPKHLSQHRHHNQQQNLSQQQHQHQQPQQQKLRSQEQVYHQHPPQYLTQEQPHSQVPDHHYLPYDKHHQHQPPQNQQPFIRRHQHSLSDSSHTHSHRLLQQQHQQQALIPQPSHHHQSSTHPQHQQQQQQQQQSQQQSQQYNRYQYLPLSQRNAPYSQYHKAEPFQPPPPYQQLPQQQQHQHQQIDSYHPPPPPHPSVQYQRALQHHQYQYLQQWKSRDRSLQERNQSPAYDSGSHQRSGPGNSSYSVASGTSSTASTSVSFLPTSTTASNLIPNSIINLTVNSSSSSPVYANAIGSTGSPAGPEMGIKSMEVEDDNFVVENVEITKQPGQTLGFYIREGNGFDRSDGVFISRIQLGTVAQTNGLLHVGDEIVTVNNVKVGNMSLDDVVILMSIPKKLVLTIRSRRNSSKNKSCPSLPMTEKQDPPVVVLKKGRSSSASALEMTEKCPDMFEPGQSYSQYPFQSADYLPRREASHDRTATSSRYASIFISPQRAEAKLLSEDGLDSNSSNSDGSLPRSVDSKDRGYLGQEVVDVSHSGYLSVTNPIYDQFSNVNDRDYMKYLIPDSIARKSAAIPIPKSPSKTGTFGAHGGYRGRSANVDNPSFTEPPYMNVGALRDGGSGIPVSSQQQQHQQQQQHYLQHHHHSSHLSHSAPHHQSSSQHYPHQYPFSQSSPQQAQQTSHPSYSHHQQQPATYSSQQYRGGLPMSLEERRRQERLRILLSSKSRYGKLLRSRSPECYNSDSELVFTPQQTSDGRGFASDYETYGGALSDDEPVYSIPRIPSSSSSELEMLLKKFTSLSQELQQEQHKLQRQLSSRDKSGRAGQLPLSRAESLSGDEYACQPLSGQGSPVPHRRAASTQTPALPPRMSRKPAKETPPSYLYGTYQQESHHQDIMGRQTGRAAPVGVAGGMPLPTSSNSMQLAKHGDPSSVPSSTSTSAAAAAAAAAAASSSPRSSAARLRNLQLTRKPLHIPYSEFEPYKADICKRVELTRSHGLDGLLSIHIMSGQGLKSSKTSLRDLYCVVAVDSINKARTMIRTGAINFDWDEAFDIDLEDSKEVSFLIYHWDPNFKHRLCFHGSILLPNYVHSGHKRYIAIKLEPKGILFVTVLYKEPALSLQRLPSIKKNALFGVELETVILMEASGLNVPILLHKCVQEVERRGLDTVGIYRLCGSARRKMMLREAFEINAMAVDLSPDNVSDIHVVTGVLKDYLRELPEPLFTNALYQMLVDALSVRLPSDPEGSAKLMLSILECLPSANQDTMALILSHLRRVASHKDKNKMPIDNLAICFGPVLLCPAPSATSDPSLDFKKHIEVLRYLLEIWDHEGSTGSTGTSKSPTADTVVSLEADDPAQQPSDPSTGQSSREEATGHVPDESNAFVDNGTSKSYGQ